MLMVTECLTSVLPIPMMGVSQINFWEHRGCFGEQMRHNAKKWGPRTRGDTPGLLESTRWRGARHS